MTVKWIIYWDIHWLARWMTDFFRQSSSVILWTTLNPWSGYIWKYFWIIWFKKIFFRLFMFPPRSLFLCTLILDPVSWVISCPQKDPNTFKTDTLGAACCTPNPFSAKVFPIIRGAGSSILSIAVRRSECRPVKWFIFLLSLSIEQLSEYQTHSHDNPLVVVDCKLKTGLQALYFVNYYKYHPLFDIVH